MSEHQTAQETKSPSPQNMVTLRSLIDQRKKGGDRFRLAEVVSIVVPICTQLAELHAKGKTLYVHPSSIGAGADGNARIVPELAASKPTDGNDLGAMAPELATGAPNARSSVFGVAAIVYEMLTLQPVSPEMRPPTELVQGLPPIVDTILSRGLVTDAAQRPDDLSAFAQAIHHFAPSSIAPPPDADESAFEVDIDVRASMMPPSASMAASHSPSVPKAPRISASDDPFAAVVDVRRSAPVAQRTSGAADELSALKARLEADTSPRWIVVKDKMDHGPFPALELLQQITVNTFSREDLLIDTHDGSKVVIKDHPEFSRFAHHAHLKREEVAEKKAVVKAEGRERTAAASKSVIGVLVVVAGLAALVFVFLQIKKSRAAADERRKQEEAMNIEGEGSIKGKAKDPAKLAGGGGGGGGGGGFGGKSYDDALKNTVSDMEAETLSTKECAAPVGGDIAGSCGLSGKATAKYVVKNGRAVGVTVVTDPSQPGVNSCMAGRISGLSWRSVSGATGCIRTFKTN